MEMSLFSKTMGKALSLFITSPKERFYLRQLCQLTKSSLRPMQLALARLEKMGILLSEREGNMRFYSINQKCPILPEIKNIVLKTDAIGAMMRDGLKDMRNIRCAFIYGSVAKDKERFTSDVDICIIGEVDLTALSRVTARLEKKLKREVSVVTFGLREWKEALSEGKAFVKDIIKNKKVILVGDIDGL